MLPFSLRWPLSVEDEDEPESFRTPSGRLEGGADNGAVRSSPKDRKFKLKPLGRNENDGKNFLSSVGLGGREEKGEVGGRETSDTTEGARDCASGHTASGIGLKIGFSQVDSGAGSSRSVTRVTMALSSKRDAEENTGRAGRGGEETGASSGRRTTVSLPSTSSTFDAMLCWPRR
jgi:hypothetical protein